MLKPQNPDLTLMAKKKLFKGKQGGGSSSQKRPFPKPNQGMSSVRNDSRIFLLLW